MDEHAEHLAVALALAALALGAWLCLQRCAAGPRASRPAPEAGLPVLLQAPRPALRSLRELRGQAVVLEFWATWCATCRDAMPRMEKLRAAFRDRPVVFLSVTAEERAAVEAYLREHPVTGWVGLDPGQALARALGATGVPQIFLIDPQGLVRLQTRPGFFYEADIERALKGARPRADLLAYPP